MHLVSKQQVNPQPTTTARATTEGAHRVAVGRVIDAMRSRVDEPLSLSRMGKIAYVSPFYFNRTFRKVTGIPPGQFLYALRLEAARRLLLTTTRSIVDICYEVGYNSLGTFTRRFTELLGAPPSRYRTLARAPMPELTRRIGFAAATQGVRQAQGSMLKGVVQGPAGFYGLVFVGLFPDPIPQGKPVACTLMAGPGEFRIACKEDGNFHLFSLGIDTPAEAEDLFHYETALRGGGQPVRVANGSVHGQFEITLRAPSEFDPPILVGLPCLLQSEEYSGEFAQAAVA
jgi:AraC-like DNA-binding protein